MISVDEPSKGLKIQGQRVKKHSLTEDFWSPSSGDMDNSAFPSHRSVSSISTSNQTLDTHSSTAGTSNSSEFVNHGKYFYTALPLIPIMFSLHDICALHQVILFINSHLESSFIHSNMITCML